MTNDMSKIKTAIKQLKSDRGEFMASIVSNFFRWLPDATYLKLLYRFKMGHRLDLKNPQTFTEKLQWLKLYNRKPEYTTMVDKYAVKNYVANIIGEEYIIPTLGVWDRYDDIDFSKLPQQFVLKTTHGGGGGGVVICRDKTTFNKADAKVKLEASMHSDIYKSLREWPYKNVPKRIIAEKFMVDYSGELRDFKFYCFDGVPKVLLVASNRFTSHNYDYFDMDFNRLPITSVAGKNNYEIKEPPSNFEKMKKLVSILSKDFSHVRIDLYNCNGDIYFGEMTFYDSSGFDDMNSNEWNSRFGSWITLPSKIN